MFYCAVVEAWSKMLMHGNVELTQPVSGRQDRALNSKDDVDLFKYFVVSFLKSCAVFISETSFFFFFHCGKSFSIFVGTTSLQTCYWSCN